MKCKTCGTEFQGDFCPGCGSPAVNNDTAEPPLKPRKFKGWWVFILVIIVLVLFFVKINRGSSQVAIANTVTQRISQTDDTSKSTIKGGTKLTDKATAEPTAPINKEYTLTAGIYTAGIDLPTGKCDVVAISGTGNLNSSNLYSGGVNEMFGIDKNTSLYTNSFNGLKLPKDVTLNVTGDLKIKITYTDIDGGFTGRTYDESKAITLKSGNYESGKDFAVGTYRVVAVSGTGNLNSSNLLNGGVNEMFGIDTGYNLYTAQFDNVNLTKEDTTLSVSGNLVIKLIPAK